MERDQERQGRRWQTELKGCDNTKPAWAYYTDKMWNYFLPRRMHHNRNGTTQTRFRTDIDRLNWDTCQRVWDRLTPEQREVMILIYCTDYDLTPGAVWQYAVRHGVTTKDVWSISAACGRMLAIERGLLAENTTGGNTDGGT